MNENYVQLTPLWQTFTNNTNGNFLRNGFVLFYDDTQRNVGKPVYQISGSPPNYEFVECGYLVTSGTFAGAWRVDLNSEGAFTQMLFGNLVDENANKTLYFVQVYSADEIFQFSREGFPYINTGGSNPINPSGNLINFAPNGQFLLNLTNQRYEDNEIKTDGKITKSLTYCAFGGWYFHVPENSTSINYVKFEKFNEYSTNPEKSPKFFVRITCTQPSPGDLFKDYKLRFKDVNKFQYFNQKFTFSFEGESLSSSNISASLILIKNFGTNGDSPTDSIITTFNISNSLSKFSFSFDFGDNSSFNIGDKMDDFLEIGLRLPTSQIFDVEFTNFLIYIGNIDNPIYPDITNRQNLIESIFDEVIPAPDGSDFGLPLILTKNGLNFDYSSIGNIVYDVSTKSKYGYLLCDGSQYNTNDLSEDGIPYKRLFNELYIESEQERYTTTLFGSGYNFCTAYLSSAQPSNTSNLILSNNNYGILPNIKDGPISTGFSFSSVHIGSNSKYNFYSSVCDSGFYIFGEINGEYTFVPIVSGAGIPNNGLSFEEKYNSDNTKFILFFNSSLTTISSLAGSGFVFGAPVVSTGAFIPSPAVLVWFTVNGVGTIPTFKYINNQNVVPDITIKIDLLSTYTQRDFNFVVSNAINGLKTTNISIPENGNIPAGSSIVFFISQNVYYAYFTVDGNGSDPLIANATAIKVETLSTDTSDQKAFKLAKAINSYCFCVPNLMDAFVKSIDLVNNNNSSLRYSSNNNILSGNNIGTSEYSSNRNHLHNQQYINVDGITTNPKRSFAWLDYPGQSGQLTYTYTYNTKKLYFRDPNLTPYNSDGPIRETGTEDCRPLNIQLVPFIKY